MLLQMYEPLIPSRIYNMWSSNLGRGCLYFTSRLYPWERYEPNYAFTAMGKYQVKLGSLASVMQANSKKEKSEFMNATAHKIYRQNKEWRMLLSLPTVCLSTCALACGNPPTGPHCFLSFICFWSFWLNTTSTDWLNLRKSSYYVFSSNYS